MTRLESGDGAPVGFWSAGDLLPGAVASVIGYRQAGDSDQGLVHRGLPSPYLTFIFSLADPVVSGLTLAQAYDSTAQRTPIVIGALHQQPVFIVPDAEQAGIQLAVHPLAARAVFGVPTSELTALVTDGSDVLGAAAVRLRERLAELTSWPARFSLLQDYLRERLAATTQGERPRPAVQEAWRWLSWHRGNGSMDGLARHLAMSGRQLSTLFQREVGCSPKQVARLMRFEHARQLIVAGHAADRLNLAAVAARAGFFDHAHLDREFAQFAGISPTGWLAEEHRNIQSGGQRNGQDWAT